MNGMIPSVHKITVLTKRITTANSNSIFIAQHRLEKASYKLAKLKDNVLPWQFMPSP